MLGHLRGWCVVDASPTCRSPLEVTRRRFAPSGRAPLHFSLSFCACCSQLAAEVCLSQPFSLMSRITLTRFHLQRPKIPPPKKKLSAMQQRHNQGNRIRIMTLKGFWERWELRRFCNTTTLYVIVYFFSKTETRITTVCRFLLFPMDDCSVRNTLSGGSLAGTAHRSQDNASVSL